MMNIPKVTKSTSVSLSTLAAIMLEPHTPERMYEDQVKIGRASKSCKSVRAQNASHLRHLSTSSPSHLQVVGPPRIQ